MSKIKNENYIVIQGFMVNELNLKGNELLIYAIIYGFSQDERQAFNGSLQYLADWTNSTKQSVLNNLKSLLDKKLISKEEKIINGVKFCKYRTTDFNTIQKSLMGYSKKFNGGIQKSLPNNINNNIEDNIDINNTTTKEASPQIFKKDIYSYIEENFGRTLAPIEYEKIREWEDTDLTRYAIKVAILNGKCNINYIDKIIYSYRRSGIVTVQQARQQEEDYENSKKKYQQHREEHKETFEEMVARVGDEWEERRMKKENAENRS